MQRKPFRPGTALESGTEYYATSKTYHIHLSDCREVVGHGYAHIDRPLATAFYLADLENVTVDLGGARLVFHGRIAPFIVSGCRNVTLRNFTVAYDRPFYTQADIVGRDERGITVSVCDGFPYRVDDGVFVAVSDTWEQPLSGDHCIVQPFDRKTMAPAFGAGCILAAFGHCDSVNPPLPVAILKAVDCGGRTVRFEGEFPPGWQPGLTIAVTHEVRDKNGILAERSSDITVERVRLEHCAAMGFVGMFCHNITLRRFDMYVDGDGLVTANADGAHCLHCTGIIDISDCVFENMLDDAVNIHGNYTVVTAAAGPQVTLEARTAAVEAIEWYRPGDVLTVYRGRTLEEQGAFTVRSVRYDGYTIHVTADRPVTAEPGDTVENAAAPDIFICRCLSGRNRGRGFLLSGSGKTVAEDCYFRSCDCAVHFTGDTSYWYESGPVRDVTVRGCFFDDCGYCGQPYAIIAAPDFVPTDKAPFYHTNVRIEGNVFRTFTGGLLQARYTDGIVFRDNRVIRSQAYPGGDIPAVSLSDCGAADTDTGA